MKRNKFNLSNYKLLSLDQGYLVPVNWFEVLPGDTVQAATSLFIRVSPLVAPVMHPVQVRVHHWFVPNRLMWDDWEEFITGGPDGMDESEWPHSLANGTVMPGSLYDYLGFPTGTYDPAQGLRFSALPVRAYGLIFNEWYRDQDLVAERPVMKTSGEEIAPDYTAVSLARVAWEKDYFTSARPWAQKGADVTIPLGTSAPVVPTSPATSPTFVRPGGSVSGLNAFAGQNVVDWDSSSASSGRVVWDQPHLQVDLQNATSATINQWREALAIQRYEEARARYGSRYTEYLRYLGVHSSDARLQRPEYLGGGKSPVQFSEVLQTAEGTDPVGMLRGHGIGAMRSNRYRRFFEEHGIVMTLVSIKPKTVYSQSMHRGWFRQVKEDYWQKELEHIGQQEIWNKELYAMHTDPHGTFGWQDRYDEYRRKESSVSGEFRTLLNYWHMARDFAAAPVLNADFVTANPTDRVYASTDTHEIYMTARNNVVARRMLSKVGSSFTF